MFTRKMLYDIISRENEKGQVLQKMNQILDYNPNKGSSGGGSSKSDKIVRVFAVLMGIFGLFLLGNAAYSLYKNNQQSATVEQAPAKASIVVEQAGVVIGGGGFFQVRQTCPTCGGEGSVIEKPCRKCRGTGHVTAPQKIALKIPAGVDSGSRLPPTLMQSIRRLVAMCTCQGFQYQP